MSFVLYRAERLDDFLDLWPELWTPELFGPSHWFIVQNAVLARWLKDGLARRQGWLGAREAPEEAPAPRRALLTPNQALRRLCGWFGPEESPPRPVFLDDLRLRVFTALRDLQARDDPGFAPLLAYAAGGGRRLWDLSNLIAGLFHDYDLNRPELPAAWETGQAIGLRGGPELAAAEVWQRQLWQRIFPQRPGSPVSLGQRLRQITTGQPYQGPVQRFTLFGSLFLSRQAQAFWSYLGSQPGVEVRACVFHPGQTDSGTEGSPSDAWALFGRPFWSHWQARRLQAPELYLEAAKPSQAAGPPRTTLLAWAQAALRGQAAGPRPQPDESLQLLAAPGPRRELEALRDRLTDWLARHPDAALWQVAVLSPNPDRYAPYLGAVFSEAAWPHHQAERKEHRPGTFAETAAAFWQLPGSRWSRRELWPLLRAPAFQNALGLESASTEFLLAALEEAGFRWGWNGAHKAARGFPAELAGTWEHAWARLWAGWAGAEPQAGSAVPQPLPGLGLEADLLARAQEKLNRLFEELESLTGQTLSLTAWADRAKAISRQFLSPAGPEDPGPGELDRQWLDLFQLALDYGAPGPELDWPSFQALFLDAWGDRRNSSAPLLAHGFHFASLKPYRALPFRLIAVLGLGEDQFPGRDDHPSFDLRAGFADSLETDRRSADTYAFLETLQSAGEALWLSWPGRDESGGADRPAAVPVEQLRAWLDLEVQKVPFHAYDPDQFRPPWFSYDARAAQLARRLESPAEGGLAGSAPIRSPDWPLRPSETEDLHLGLRDLSDLARAPARLFLRRRVQFYQPREAHPEDQWQEPFEAGFEQSWDIEPLWQQARAQGSLPGASELWQQRIDAAQAVPSPLQDLYQARWQKRLDWAADQGAWQRGVLPRSQALSWPRLPLRLSGPLGWFRTDDEGQCWAAAFQTDDSDAGLVPAWLGLWAWAQSQGLQAGGLLVWNAKTGAPPEARPWPQELGAPGPWLGEFAEAWLSHLSRPQAFWYPDFWAAVPGKGRPAGTLAAWAEDIWSGAEGSDYSRLAKDPLRALVWPAGPQWSEAELSRLWPLAYALRGQVEPAQGGRHEA